VAERRGRDSPAADDRTVFRVARQRCAGASGVQRWKSALPFRPISGPLKWSETLVVAGTEPSVQAFSTSDGKSFGRYGVSTELSAPPYLFVDSARVFPVLVTISSDIVGRATVTGATRDIEPAMSDVAECRTGCRRFRVRRPRSQRPPGARQGARLAPVSVIRAAAVRPIREREPRMASAIICSGITARPISGTNAISPSQCECRTRRPDAQGDHERASSANSARMKAITARNVAEADIAPTIFASTVLKLTSVTTR
jgi:hypothetical protein